MSELATAIAADRPRIKVVLMSGNADRLRLKEEWSFLQKPFRLSQLSAVVGGLLRREEES
jgi:DNA-binding NtrC family response regulator